MRLVRQMGERCAVEWCRWVAGGERKAAIRRWYDCGCAGRSRCRRSLEVAVGAVRRRMVSARSDSCSDDLRSARWWIVYAMLSRDA